MSRILKIQQLNFDKGMIENIKQNIYSDSNSAITSLLWLENWQPNKEHFTLVKRNGEIRYTENTFTFDFNYGSLIAAYNNDFSPIQHASLIRTVNPIQYSQFVLICSTSASNELIKVYASEPRVVNNAMQFLGQYHNVKDDNLLYQGIVDIFGTLGDTAKYGDSLLFSTYSRINTYNAVGSVWYPCYVFTRFDISKKRQEGVNRYWNGVNLLDNYVKLVPELTDNNNHLYVKPPTQSISNLIKSTRRREVGSSGLKYYDADEVEETSVADFTVYFQEEPLGNIQHATWTGNAEISGNNSYTSYKQPSLSAYVDKDFQSVCNAVATYDMPKYNWYREMLIAQGFTIAQADARVLTVRNHTDILGDSLGSFTLAYVSNGDYKDIQIYILPDYISANIPRCWAKEDRIPFVITLTINGVEYLFYEDTYIIKKQNAVIPNVATHSDNLNIRDFEFVFGIAPMYHLGDKIYGDRGKFFDLGSTTQHKASPYIADRVADNSELSNCLYFGIRLNPDTLSKFIEIGVTSVNLYVSKPSTTRHIVDYAGVISINPIPPTLYSLPITDENTGDTDYSQYALVNRFVIEGEGVYDPTDEYDSYRPGYYNMNGWAWDKANNSLIAVPQDKDSNAKVNVRYTNYDSVVLKDNCHTPNFILWDYPSESEPLILQGTGKYWEGKGARLINVVQGRTFLAGCIDKNGIEEQGIVRFSQVQSGNISPDLFNDEDKLRVGFLSHTAFAMYREQLWLFNRQTWYQIIIPNITDYSQWEFVNAIDGQGTFSPKTIATTPFGICFANENGIWLTDGGKPECLTYDPDKGLAIKSLYQHLATNQSYIYTSLIALGNPPIDSSLGYNACMELVYNEEDDELCLITPVESDHDNSPLVYDKELRLIYSFANHSWRVETFVLGNIITYSNIHRVHFSYNRFFHTRLDSSNNNNIINFGYRDNTTKETDEYSIGGITTTQNITGNLLSHEIGNGKNDYLFHSGVLEVQSKDLTYDYFANTDPQLLYLRRNTDWITQTRTQDYSWGDLMLQNMNVKALAGENPFIALTQTPSAAANYNLEGLEFVVGRESLHLLAPLNSKFRRMRINLISEKIVKIRNITLNIVELQRKGFG